MPTRTYEWISPQALPVDRSGLALMQAIVRGELPPPPIAQTLDYRIIEIAEGRVVFACTPQEFHYNPIGLVHGGLAATLLDSAMGCAVHTTLPAGTAYSTLELKVSYLRGITLQTGLVRAIGTVLQSGRSAAFAEGRIEDAQGRLLAHATTTCIVKR